jgi:Flp pilus assembly protein TadG
MIVRRARGHRRGGATTVEVAVVISVFLMFLFGIFEYCRFLLMMHVTTNAARDSARYAVVNVGKPTDFDTDEFTDPGGNVYPAIKTYCDTKMVNIKNMLTGYTVDVFPCDPAQLAATPPVIAPKPGFPGTVSWNAATFSERIAVRVTGTYRPVLPSFLMMDANIPVNITVTMGSEG